ncbi:hypothetical protein GUJ93_ZPchr0011g27345 [Zizania palustris]|uniref:Uncharacterized protein n=1 Tax=Zizania palustris TaxID=103762 RepID=A0A8J5WKK3_ZIZPA|nr:hypothetical protein GUJ93_ZPchr0011g27345 [Zizania palustris]
MVETIPNEFENLLVYRYPTIEEIWNQICSGMDTISIGLNVGLDVKKLKNSSRPNKYEVKLILRKVMKKDMPKRGDIMLLSKRGLNSSDQIIKAGSFCTILVVTLVNDHVEDYPASMHVWLSQSPYGGSPNDQTSYQADGKFTDKDFGLNKSQRDAVESCFSASECSKHRKTTFPIRSDHNSIYIYNKYILLDKDTEDKLSKNEDLISIGEVCCNYRAFQSSLRPQQQISDAVMALFAESLNNRYPEKFCVDPVVMKYVVMELL